VEPGGPVASLRRLLRGAPPLRPPGALDEAAFLARCLRCGRCAEVCPYRSLRPAGARRGLAAGTPEIVAREAPCWLCLRCPPACPTGALAPVAELRDVRMGRARVLTERCYAHHGVLCRTCLDACPLQGTALVQDGELRPVVTERCVGCGLCEQRCPVDGAAIVVDPRREA
jgi:MauM/NapG family ferredoxin protein